jgi:hypothetical protein
MSVRIPKYRLHKGSGQALVQINRIRTYLGKHGTPESQEEYRRVVAEWLESRQHNVPQPVDRGPGCTLSVNELIVAFWQFVESYYVKDGEPTDEQSGIRDALLPLQQLYGSTNAADFGPKSLQAVRQHMIDVQKLSRKVINQRIGRIKRAFKWAVAEELVPPSVFHGLQAVGGLRFGRTEARETEPIKPVPDEHVDAVQPFISPHVAAMIQFQRLTGVRPCEVVIVRACDIDMSGEVWVYEPPDHKNRWRGKHRQIPIGPKAQAILKPFLDRDPTAYLFSPKEANEWRRQQRLAQSGVDRKTPIYPSELRSREKVKQSRRSRTAKRQKHDRYDTNSYRKAIEYAFIKARKAGVEIPHWHPNQLRHNRGTEVRKVVRRRSRSGDSWARTG